MADINCIYVTVYPDDHLPAAELDRESDNGIHLIYKLTGRAMKFIIPCIYV